MHPQILAPLTCEGGVSAADGGEYSFLRTKKAPVAKATGAFVMFLEIQLIGDGSNFNGVIVAASFTENRTIAFEGQIANINVA